MIVLRKMVRRVENQQVSVYLYTTVLLFGFLPIYYSQRLIEI
jgi:hypothetical protein